VIQLSVTKGFYNILFNILTHWLVFILYIFVLDHNQMCTFIKRQFSFMSVPNEIHRMLLLINVSRN